MIKFQLIPNSYQTANAASDNNTKNNIKINLDVVYLSQTSPHLLTILSHTFSLIFLYY